MESTTTLKDLANFYDNKEYLALNEKMTFEEYIEKVQSNPKLARNSFQYVYDMIMEAGVVKFERYRKTCTRYNFFKDCDSPIFGLEETLEDLVDFIHGAAGHYGTEKRVLLLHGPVGSSKSTICRRLKRGLEAYSKTDAGAWYTYKWVGLPIEADKLGPAIYTDDTDICPMNENPIKLMPKAMRDVFMKQINEIHAGLTPNKSDVYKLVCDGDLNPRCKLFMKMLLERYNGNWLEVVKNHIVVIRRVHSEIDRVGIGTFQPKDEKNQDSTELTGDMNFSKIGHFGSDSDSRAFNFDGEFQVANRGICEFIEMLKLANEFLYDLLGASQEHQIKPKKFAQIVVDEFIIAHTNNPEYEKLKDNRFMEALRDRTVKIDVPYLTRWSDEVKVLEQDYGPGKVPQHIMPHTLEIAAFFAVISRLETDEKLNLTDKAKLYDGKALPGWTEDSVKEYRDRYPDEGMTRGVSARYIQCAISNCLARRKDYINVFHVMSELKSGIGESSLITNIEDRKHYEYCIELATKELDEILKKEVQRALVADEKAMERLCNKYLDNVFAYVNNEKMTNPITGAFIDPDERLMRSIEEKAGITDRGCNDFRQAIATSIASFSRRGEVFQWDSNEELRRAIESKVFEDIKDTIKLSTLTKEASELDPELQEKIDAIKTRLIKSYGYNYQSATDVLEYVASIFARGDAAN